MTARDTGVVRDRASGTGVTATIIPIDPTLSFHARAPVLDHLTMPEASRTASSTGSTWVPVDDGQMSTTHAHRPRRAASVCLVYVQFVSRCGTRVHARGLPCCHQVLSARSKSVPCGVGSCVRRSSPRPSTEAHALGCIVAVLAGSMLTGLKQVSAIENRPAADRSRSRDFLPRSTFEARLEGTRRREV